MRGVPVRRLAAVVGLGLFGGGGRATAGDAPAAPFDPENPRNVRFEGPVIETVRAPRPVPPPGERAAWPEGTEVRFEVVTRRLPSGGGVADPAADEEPLVRLDGAVRGPVRGADGTYFPWRADGQRHLLEVSYGSDRATVATDALRIHLQVEKRTFDAGEKRFGSFTRRLRKSLDDLHALFEASVHPLAPRGVLERFRVDRVKTFVRRVGQSLPPSADSGWDVNLLCEEDGDYAFGGDGPPANEVFWWAPRLWSSAGERSLWRALLLSRGVPDLSLWEIAPGALPGRYVGPIPLPVRFAGDLTQGAFAPPRVCEYTAVVANLRRGIVVPGDPVTSSEVAFGRGDGALWNSLPGRVALALRAGGKPVEGATVRWWRARGDGVAADRAPDGEATADAKGTISITGDYLGRGDTLHRRSRWLLVEVARGDERRFEILYGLDLHLAYVRGAKYVHGIAWDVEDMIPVGATSLRKGR